MTSTAERIATPSVVPPLRVVSDVRATTQSDLAVLSDLKVELKLPNGTCLTVESQVPTDAGTVQAYLKSIADGFYQQLIDLGWFVGGTRTST